MYAWRNTSNYHDGYYDIGSSPLHVLTAAPGAAPVDYSYVESSSTQDASATAVAANGRAVVGAVTDETLLVAGRRPGGRFGALVPRIRIPGGTGLLSFTLAVNSSGRWAATLETGGGVTAVIGRGAGARLHHYAIEDPPYYPRTMSTVVDGRGTASIAYIDAATLRVATAR
jgi:hypothetical protein